MASEKNIMNQCLVALSKLVGTRVWRNNTGQAWTGSKVIPLTPGHVIRAAAGDVLVRQARPINFGLPGSADILGVHAVKITPDMVGRHIGQFIAVEVKRPGGRQSKQQIKFESMVRSMGGAYVLATSPAEAVAIAETGGSHDE